MASVLNRKEFTRDALDEDSFVAIADRVKNDPYSRIKRALQEKFKGPFSPRLLPSREDAGSPLDLVGYACLYTNLQFRIPFERISDTLFFEGIPVSRFGVGPFPGPDQAELPAQFDVVDDPGTGSFIVKLKARTRGDRILALPDPDAAGGRLRSLLRPLGDQPRGFGQADPQAPPADLIPPDPAPNRGVGGKKRL